MTRVLLCSSPEKGHLNPLAALAEALRAAGAHVGWLCLPEPSPQLDALGVEVVHAELPAPAAGAPALVTGGEALAGLVRDPARLRGWIRTLLLDLVPGQIEPVRRALRGFAPDVVATDGMQYAMVLAAHLEGVPWAGISTALTLLEPPLPGWALLENVRALAADRAALFARHGLPAQRFRTCEALSPRQNTIFATRALVGADADVPPATELVGPARVTGARGDEPGAFPWARLEPGRSLVYVSFGSQISWQPEIFAAVAEAAAPLEVQLVIVCGELAGTSWAARLPGRVVAVPYAPQRALLERAACMITHGGANSVMEAMAAGVPLLVSPVCNDQPVQAHVVGRAGAGIAMDLHGAGVKTVRAALARLVAPDAPERARARAIAVDYARHDGGRRAAELVLELAKPR
jgi:MGT family glycosyltransferase